MNLTQHILDIRSRAALADAAAMCPVRDIRAGVAGSDNNRWRGFFSYFFA